MATSNIHKDGYDKKLLHEINILDKHFFLLTARSSCFVQSLSLQTLAADSQYVFSSSNDTVCMYSQKPMLHTLRDSNSGM